MIPGLPSEVLVDVQHLSKRFATGKVDIRRTGLRAISGELLLHRPRRRPALRRGEFFALDDVSFQLRAGEALGVLGENGAGKTTLLRVLAGLSRPDFGRVSLRGTSGALIELGTSFDPNSTGREALATEAALIGVAGDQREGWMDRLVDFSDLGSFIDAPLRTYSQGMLMRLGYAAAIAAEPSVLLIDEVLSVGDLGFQRKCMQFIHGFLARGGALVLVSHDLFTLRSVCSRCLVLEGGRLLAEGDVDEVVDLYVRRSFAAPSDADGGPADPPQDVPHGFDGEVPSRAPVVVRGATLSHPRGGPARSQGPARIEVEYECSGDRAGRPADEAPDRPGGVVWGFAISGAGHSLPAVQAQCPLPLAEGLPAGRGRVSCVIDDLPLVGGLYELRVGFFDADSGVVLAQKGWFDSPLQVEVAAEAAHRSTLEKVAGVLGVLDVDWKPGAEQLSGFAQPRPVQPTTAR